MSINNAMNTGVSGMSAEGEALGVVGDNVANTNTIGFKQSRAIFEDVLGGAMGSGAVGAGVRMSRVQQIFAQGALVNTGQPTDLALSGDGFFVVHGTLNGLTSDFYTRAGQMTLAADGRLVDMNGLSLLGYGVNPDGSFGPATGAVQVSTAALQPVATQTLTITANMDSTQAVPTAAWDPQNPSATSNFSTSMSVYDSLGNAHAVNIYFVKTAAGAWTYHALAEGGEVTGGTAGQNVDIATGTLTFNTSGALQATATTSGGTVNWVNATPAQALTFDFGTSIAAGGTGLGGTTQFAAPSSISSQGQDGYASGSFTGIQIDSSGVVNGVYSNGQKIAVAQLAVAKFRSNDGLGRAGHNLWVATRDSGDAALGTAGSGGRPAIVSGALEQSNVDIAQQFVDLIAHQRAFQANSKTITTVDEMLQDVMNLKR
jgi:flagellar hook protein FlgE